MNLRTPQLACVFAVLAPAWLAGAAAPEPAADGTVPCKIQQRVPITFPYRALNDGFVTGEAVLMLDVSRTGELGDVLVVAYTRREFADAALEAIRQWRFSPARIGADPVRSTIRLAVQFEVNGVLAYVKPVGSTEREADWTDRYAYQPVSVRRLDRVPSAISQPGPIYPREWIDAGRIGSVVVEFFIDEKGRVRFPQIINESDEFLGAAALAAVREWRFEPPMHRGRPVLTRASQVFDFRPAAARAAR